MNRELRRIAIVGPVYPYKGGIAHYTGLLCKSLRGQFETQMISFEVQYPKILFRKEQKDFENNSFEVQDTKYILHTANPFSWGKCAREILAGKPDLVIFQWWHPYFAPCYRSLLRKLRRGGVKTLFICHNVFPHERFPMDRALTKMVLKKGDFFITHSKTDAADLRSIRRDAAVCEAVHPTYDAFQFQNLTREEARQKLGLGGQEQVLLFFGFVREYKGLKHLIAALPGIAKRLPKVHLLIVGDFGKDKQEYLELIAQNNAEQFLTICDGYIPDQEVEQYFAASDLVVLPYESATQSGIVQIAYGFERPVVATNVGGLPDVVLHEKTGYLVPPRDPKALAEAVVRFFEEQKAEAFAENIRQEAARYSWDRMRENICSLWEQQE